VEGAGLGLALFDAEARANLAAADDDNGPSKMIMDQVHTVLDVLKVLRTVESATSVENGALVTHSLTVIQDVN
jgi:hypothetical protein